MEAAIEETTAEANGSRLGEYWFWDFLEGEGWIALAVRARMAFCDFLVPKARPNSERAESACTGREISKNLPIDRDTKTRIRSIFHIVFILPIVARDSSS